VNISIRPANQADIATITAIGRTAVELAHRDSCSPTDMVAFLDEYYNPQAIEEQLLDKNNNYFLLLADGQPAGFSNVVMNARHPNIAHNNATKLDRIYLLSTYYGLGLGYQLLQHNIQLSQQSGQCCMWLFTWQGNTRAIDFYKQHGFKVIAEHKFKITETHYNPHFQMMLEY
jgi:ribosomal protein S18 acetylase RimI-like enzyme